MSEKFWDKVAAMYSRRPVSDEVSYKRKISETQKYFTSDMHILEFGCGTGTTAIYHAPHVQYIDAIDISENMLDIGRFKAKQANVENINFSKGTLFDFNFEPESLDAVLGLNIIHLLDDRKGTLEYIARVIKPGGIFVSSTLCLGNSFLRFVRLFIPIGKVLGLIHDVYILTESELVKEIQDSGFSIEVQWHHGKDDVSVFIIARKI
ncbi:class I SAM-dependent methyltransferase [Photobacterium rosenbergii]|nr:class I SAM-dependent methyltransferase [Photobacterium rosenbergii]